MSAGGALAGRRTLVICLYCSLLGRRKVGQDFLPHDHCVLDEGAACLCLAHGEQRPIVAEDQGVALVLA